VATWRCSWAESRGGGRGGAGRLVAARDLEWESSIQARGQGQGGGQGEQAAEGGAGQGARLGEPGGLLAAHPQP
jgi:hypothetical protein